MDEIFGLWSIVHAHVHVLNIARRRPAVGDWEHLAKEPVPVGCSHAAKWFLPPLL